MNKLTQQAPETTESIVGHLGHWLPDSAASELTDASLERSESAIPASMEELTRGLQDLLGRYVALLESADHGGWNRDEDEAVLRTLSLLERTGGRKNDGTSQVTNSQVSAAITFAPDPPLG
jgi:hypothetical protein